MKGVAHRVHDGAEVGGDTVQGEHVGGGHDDEFREGPVPVDADDARVAADVAVARAALQAMPAHDVAFSGDELPYAQLRDTLAHRHDLPGEFVPHHDRRMDPALGPGIPLVNMDISAAD